jgi:release factor glutamine methyltransferase
VTSERILDLVARAAPYLGKHGSDSPRLDAELLMAQALGIERIDLYLQFERPLTEAEVSTYRALCRRRAGGEPVAYIRGRREFMSLDLLVTPAVMIPRPETEVLVEEGLRRLWGAVASGRDGLRALDVGTGSGAIAVALAVELRRGDLTAGIEGSFDLVAANLPYIDPEWDGAVTPEVAASEPAEALFAGKNGLDVVGRLLPQLDSLLAEGSAALIEFDSRQRTHLVPLAEHLGRVRILPDLAGLDRVLVLER